LYEKVAGLARVKVGQEAMSRGDFKIYTTIDRKAQLEAEEALAAQLKAIEEVPGYDHVLYRDHESGEEGMPDYLQGAVLMADSRSGAVRAYVGGRDYSDSQFDFIELGRRPLGTAFLPFIYSAALDNGWHPSSTVEDSPMDNRSMMVGGREGILGEWGMEVANPRYEGRITSRRALAESKIAASVRLGREVGLETVVEHARGFGFDFNEAKLLNRVFLGSEAVSLREAVLAYSAFSQGGRMPSTLRFIERIENGAGEPVYEARNAAGEARPVPGLDGAGAFQVHSMLQDTLRTGNLRNEEARPGTDAFPGVVKTGTTNTFSDGWCLGYNGTVSLGIWVGFAQGGDEPIHDGAFGKSLAYPAWARVMSESESLFGSMEVPVPDSVELVGVCERSGLLATPRYCYDRVETPEGERNYRTVYREYLRKDRENLGFCDVHGQGGVAIGEVLSNYGPDAVKSTHEETLAVTPIRPQAPALIGSDPYNSVVLSLAPGSEDGMAVMLGPVFLQDFGVPGEEEATFRLPLPEKIEIDLD
jgi:penicillin-binding protein 1A